ncbi:MAG: T9SS type A sorting domain-containing protein [Putridiphycobacter sp.]
MKKNKILLGSVATAVVATAFVLVARAQDELVNGVEETTTIGNPNADFYAKVRSNVSTGLVSYEDWLRAKNELSYMTVDRAAIDWTEEGPSNIGGRTRAILIDKNDNDHVFAGSVTGGLYESTNGGNVWSKVTGFDENLSISSMCMTDDGKIYVGTGHSAEVPTSTTATNQHSGSMGKGIYVSSDNGATFSMVSGSDAFVYVNEVVAKGNEVIAATDQGPKKISGGSISDLGSLTGNCRAVAVEGDIILANVDNDTHLSTNGGSSFSIVSGSVLPTLENNGSIEYAISDTVQDGNYYAYAIVSKADGFLKGVYKSVNGGSSWTEIAPENTGAVGSFGPLLGLGNYNMAIAVYPKDPESILIGGQDIYSKTGTGNWEQRSNSFVLSTLPFYSHSGQNEFQWDENNKLYIGNGGGIYYSYDLGYTFVEANRNYNVAQFYSVSASAHGDVLGGTQGNASLVNYHNNSHYKDFERVIPAGGSASANGYDCAMSFINKNIYFVSTDNNQIYRTGDGGESILPLNLGGYYIGFGAIPTMSQVELYENPNDLNSTDSIVYYQYDTTQVAGSTIPVQSTTSGAIIDYVTPVELLFQDTLDYDPAQTTLDTLVVKDTINGIAITNNVNLEGYAFVNSGQAPSIDLGDSLLIGSDTIIVKGIDFTDHYWGTNPARPGVLIDMVQSEVLYEVRWDTAVVQDVYQSWLAIGRGDGSGLYLTRDALRLGKTLKDDEDGIFLNAASGMTGLVSCMEFSADGNHLFVGTEAGEVWRLSGLGSIYSPNLKSASGIPLDTVLNWNGGHTGTTFEKIGDFGQFVTNIASDKQDADHVVVTLGQYGGTTDKIQESINATGVAVTFNGIEGNLASTFSQKIPVYSVVIDRDNSNLILVGTDFGVFQSTNSGSTWENVSGVFGNVPVFDMTQAWRTWDEGNYVPGRIYIATHGAGIWYSNEYLSIEEAQDNLEFDNFVQELMVYPNPVKGTGNIAFELSADADVNIEIYAINGKLIQSVRKNNLSKGTNVINIETSDLAKGTYIVRMTAGELVKTTKFIKQ